MPSVRHNQPVHFSRAEEALRGGVHVNKEHRSRERQAGPDRH